eukprot:COSAG06_NODE_58871_length_276_cov_0.480226_1_plen_72_part_01
MVNEWVFRYSSDRGDLPPDPNSFPTRRPSHLHPRRYTIILRSYHPPLRSPPLRPLRHSRRLLRLLRAAVLRH